MAVGAAEYLGEGGELGLPVRGPDAKARLNLLNARQSIVYRHCKTSRPDRRWQ